MAIIDFLDGVDPFTGSRRGVTFDVSQAGPTAKRRASPVNRQTNRRMQLRAWLHQINQYYWNLTHLQKMLWGGWGADNGIAGPYGAHGVQGGCAAFFFVQLRALMADDPLYPDPPGPIPIPGVNITNLVLIDKDTIRATFNPSPIGANNHVGLMQTVPTAGAYPGICDPDYCLGLSPLNATSPHDFPTYFQHLTGLKVRYKIGTQDNKGRRSILDTYNL